MMVVTLSRDGFLISPEVANVRFICRRYAKKCPCNHGGKHPPCKRVVAQSRSKTKGKPFFLLLLAVNLAQVPSKGGKGVNVSTLGSVGAQWGR